MKKILTAFLTIMAVFAFAACGNTSTTNTEPPKDKTEKKVLVAYFSRADENYEVGYIEKGNTKIVAEMLAQMTGADLFEIKPVKPYPKEYEPATEIAKKEKEENARPQIVEPLPNIRDYDMIYLGYPIWWGDLPMAMYTFFDKSNFTGKTVAPFATHAGSGLAGTEEYIANATKAKVLKGIEIRGSLAQNSPDTVKEELAKWVANME